MTAASIFQRLFGAWLLLMFAMTVAGYRPPDEILSPAGRLWASVNLRPDMIVALAVIYGVGALTFLGNRYVALGAAMQTPLAVNMAMYHAFVNRVLVPGGLLATLYVACVLAMLWLNRRAYRPLFEAKPRD